MGVVSPLSSLRVLEIGDSIASSKACMLLADYGAEVIKIAPPPADPVRPGYYAWNRGKRCVSLDLSGDSGLTLSRRLVADADVVVVCDTRDTLEPYGFDSKSLRSLHPNLIVVSMPPLGERGPLRHLPADDMLVSAITGVSMGQYSYADQPVHLVIPLVSYGQAMTAAGAVAAGVFEKILCGHGQSIVVSGLHGTTAQEAGANVGTGADGRTIKRGAGNDSRGTLPYLRAYECADGEWVFLVSMTGAFVVGAFSILGLEDLLADPRFADGVRYALRSPEVAAEVELRMATAFKSRPREEWLRIMSAADVPCAPVLSRAEWFASAEVAANEMRVKGTDPEIGEFEMVGLPVKFSETPGRIGDRTIEADADEVSWLHPGLAAEEVSTQPVRLSGAVPRGPLAGVTVLDLTFFVAGPVCSSILADFGARVIKVEPTDGDPFRPYRVTFMGWNRGRESLSLDLKDGAALLAFYQLVASADVVVDNFRPGVAARLGVDYESLSAINPTIIGCSITGYGRHRPEDSRPGFDPLLQAQSGMQHAQGGGTEPVFLQIGINDTGSGTIAAFGIISALVARLRQGRGQQVETSLANQSVFGQSGELVLYEGAPAAEIGSVDHNGRSAGYRFYRCKNDQWLALACVSPDQFKRACEALGAPAALMAIADRGLLEPADGEIAAALSDLLAGVDRRTALTALLESNVPAAPAVRLDEEIFSEPQLLANDFWTEFPDAEGGVVNVMSHWAEWERTQADPPGPAPPLGQDSVRILKEFGVPEDTISQLAEQGRLKQHDGSAQEYKNNG